MGKLLAREVAIFPENFKSLNSLYTVHKTNPKKVQKANLRSKCLNKDVNFARIQFFGLSPLLMQNPIRTHFWIQNFYLCTDFQNFCGNV